MNQFIKNLEFAQVFKFADQVSYLPGQIVSKTLAQNESISLTLFAFDEGEEISTHESSGDALVLALDGEVKLQLTERILILKAGVPF
jgi:quercetin dioxygenase-like cupin family protein